MIAGGLHARKLCNQVHGISHDDGYKPILNNIIELPFLDCKRLKLHQKLLSVTSRFVKASSPPASPLVEITQKCRPNKGLRIADRSL
eukprot:1408094-Amphidinium_carterae.1